MHVDLRVVRMRAQIVSGSRDKSIKLWNTIGECKYTIGEPDGHTDWVSCVRFSPVTTNPIIVSAGWDKLVKVRAAWFLDAAVVACLRLCSRAWQHVVVLRGAHGARHAAPGSVAQGAGAGCAAVKATY